MTVLAEIHGAHDATFETVGDRQVVAHYGRPESAHRAVRNAVGVTEHCYDVVVVTGADRHEYVDNAVSNAVPSTDGRGTYALLLDPQGRVETDMYVFNAEERLLTFLPPGQGTPLAEEWREKTFIQDVDIAVETDEFVTLGIHGPKATEKIASVFTEQTPDEQLSFVRGSIVGEGATVIRTDALTGEEGYLVVCDASVAETVFNTLETRGLNAAPFGSRTWRSLTLEAGTPLFDTELADRLPNNLGLRNAIDFEKGCFVGQEVVSRVENRGQPGNNLVGIALDGGPEPGESDADRMAIEPEVGAKEKVPDAGATVFVGDKTIGEVTRGIWSPSRQQPVALALVDFDAKRGDCSVRIEGEEHAGQLVELPLVEGSEQSARLPAY
jgi:aminomethyltransferase